MSFFEEPLFQVVFESSTPRLIVRSDMPHFTIEARNRTLDQLTAFIQPLEPPVTLSRFCERAGWETAFSRKLIAAAEQVCHTEQRMMVLPPFIQENAAGACRQADLEILPVKLKGEMYLVIDFSGMANTRLTRAEASVIPVSSTTSTTQTDSLQPATNAEDGSQPPTRTQTYSEAAFQRMLQEAPMAICILRGRNLVVEAVNDQMLAIWGKKENRINRPFAEVLPELQTQPFLQILDEVYTSGKPYQGVENEAVLMHAGISRKMYFNYVFYPMKEAGKETRIMVVANDVTAQVTAVHLVKQSQLRLQNIVSTAPIGITVLKGKELVVELANDPMLAIWGRSREQMIGNRLLDVFPELKDQPFPEMLLHIFSSGTRLNISEIEVNIVSTDGETLHRYVDFSYDPLLDETGQVEAVLAIVKDITEQVVYRKAVEHAEEMSRMAIEASQAGNWHLDLQTNTFTASSRLKELYGYHPEEKMLFEDAVQLIPGKYRNAVQQAVEETIAKGKAYNQEFPVLGLHDRKLRWVKAAGKLFTEASGKGKYFAGIKMDITEQKENDIRKNDFIGMVSHELKTPLTSLKSYIQILQLKEKTEQDPFRQATLEKANRQVNRMQRMINSFLSIAAMESGRLQVFKECFDLLPVIKESLEDAMLSYPNVIFRLKATGSVMVEADTDKIGQVLTNLLSNAVKYAPSGKEVQVYCRLVNEMVEVSVQDQGIGICPEDLNRLFERFYRVDNEQVKNVVGFGIGLYLCQEIVSRHGGSIWAESEVGKGTVFTFSLPVYRLAAEQAG